MDQACAKLEVFEESEENHPPKKGISSIRGKFARLLVERRKACLYKTAYAFFKSGGGEAHFGFSYNHYLLIEKGRRLPSIESFKRIVENLIPSAKHDIYGNHDLMRTYVKAVLEGDSFFDVLFEPTPSSAENQPSSLSDEELLKLVARQKAVSVPYLTKEQTELCLSSPETFWISWWLEETGRRATLEELASQIKMPETKVAVALEKLVNAGVVSQDQNEFSSPFFKTRVYSHPGLSKEQRTAATGHITKMLLSPEAEIVDQDRVALVLSNERQLQDIVKLFAAPIDKCRLLRSGEPAEKGMFATIEVRISKLLEIEE